MNKLILGIVMLSMLIAFSAPAMGACNPGCVTTACGTSGCVNGTVYTSGGEPPASSQRVYHWDFNDIPAGATVKWARLYWHIWMPGAKTNATFCNATGCTDRTINISNTVNCNQNETEGFYYGGSGTCWVYWNVTDLVTSGANNATVSNLPAGDGRTFQMYLIVVYEKSGYPQTNYWINQGYMDLNWGGGAAPQYTTSFTGTATTTTNGTLWQLALCHNDKAEIWFNNTVGSNLVETTNGLGSYGLLEEYEIPAGCIVTNNNSMTWKSWDPFYHPALAIFMDSRTPGKDLIVEAIGFNPETPRPNRNFVVTADIKNRGNISITNSFNVGLYVNGVLNSTKQAIPSLGAGGSTTVNFPNVNLPEGCYEFKVVADCDGAIAELIENNNDATVNHQVGYVIIVNNNSDFERLNTTGDTPLPAGCFFYCGGTYHILNLTITNCAGDGITIKNVNVPYVIANCTIHNCTGGSNGVFLNNVTGGTVTNCIIHDNQHYGIKVGDVPLDSTDPKLVNITCNEIYRNYVDGIDLIGFNCTVKCNTVRDNMIYGIYVHGNDNKICGNNTISSNGKYGIKLYNSSGNHIYRNDLIDNNDSGVQAYDNRATNYWSSSAADNYCYSNTIRSNLIGNHWDDHITPDATGDGIVDTSYALDGGAGAVDSVPQVVEWILCGDVDRDGSAGTNDGVMIIRGLWGNCACKWNADVDCDGYAGTNDAVLVLKGEPLRCCCNANPCICGHCFCHP